MSFRLILWVSLAWISSLPYVHADPLKSKAALLAEDPFWLLLNHYEQTALGQWRSHVVDAKFFFSTEGAESPQQELQATLKALYAQPTEGANSNQHAQCVYPARTRWLREQLQLKDLPAVECPEFRDWFKEIHPHQVVLIFPAAHLNSPSSIFGHTLLRVDPPESVSQGSSLLSYALNFGASIDDADNSMLYAWKGLMGGYPGEFAILPYHEKLAEYNRLENRDLWEYNLDITPEEAVRMVEHVWELRQVKFDYFFFDENCSYRVLELLEVARPGLHLTQDFSLTAIPTDTVKAVKDVGIVTDVRYRSSKERELLVQEQRLTPAERHQALALAEGVSESLPQTQEAALVQDVAYRLLRYRAAGKDRDPEIARRSYDLLRAIKDNPASEPKIVRPALPEEGHQSRTLSVDFGQREARTFADYNLRMAYHDLNDNLHGFPLGAQIEIAKIGVRHYEGGLWQLQQLELAGIRSMTPRTDLLKPWSWQVRGGLERVLSKNEREELVSHISGGAGWTQEWTDNLRTFALGTVRLEHNSDFNTLMAPAVGFNVGALWRNAWGNLVVESSGDYFRNGEARRQLQLVQQWELSQNLGVRFSMRRVFSQRYEPVTEGSLGIRWYFY